MCAFVDKHRDEHGVEPICKVLQIVPSTYYARRSRPESARAVSDRELGEKIESIHAENYGVYGARNIHKELGRQDIPAARCTVERLMRQKGLRGISRSKGPRTTKPAPETGRPADLVERRFQAAAPNRLWLADITYVRTFAGWVYVAFVIDVFSRRVVGWQVATSLYTDLALDALEMGIWARARDGAELSGLVHHSDRGVQAVFNRSKQHLIMEVLDAVEKSSEASPGISRTDTFAWSAIGGVARGPGAVLGGDRLGCEDSGCQRRGRRVRARRASLVPARWRSESSAGPDTIRAVPFLKRPGGHCVVAGAGLRGAGNSSAAGPKPVDDLAGAAPKRVYENVSVGLQGVNGAVARRTTSPPSQDRKADHEPVPP
jgi:putative transposase